MNKELEKENEELHKEINERIKLKIENEHLVDTQFISKQKILDKIEEYNQIIDETNDGDLIHELLVKIYNYKELLDE